MTNTQSKHTSGPWQIEDNAIVDGNSNIIARMQTYGAWFGPTPSTLSPQRIGEANARLIASTPKLLEALQALVEATSGHARHFEEHKYAVAVFAKATGRAA